MQRPESNFEPEPEPSEGGATHRTGHCPTAIELASWVDGRLPLEEMVRIELHVARCADCYALVGGVDFEAPADLAPHRLVEAASRLMPAEGAEPAPSFAFSTLLRRGLAVAAALGIAWAGYAIGTSLCGSYSSSWWTSPSGGSNQLANSTPEPDSQATETQLASGDSPTSNSTDVDAATTASYFSFGLLGSDTADSDTVELASRLLLLEVTP